MEKGDWYMEKKNKKVLFFLLFVFLFERADCKELNYIRFQNINNIYGTWKAIDCKIIKASKQSYFLESLKNNEDCKKYLEKSIIIDKKNLKTNIFNIEDYFEYKIQNGFQIISKPKYSYYTKYKKENYNIDRQYGDFNVLSENVFRLKLYLNKKSPDYLDMKDICHNEFCFKNILSYVILDNGTEFISYPTLFNNINNRVFIILKKVE